MMKVGHKMFQHATYFSWCVFTAKKLNFMILPLARNVKSGAGSVQAMQLPRKGYGCQL